MRIRAVERVQGGESPEVVIRAMGFTRSCIYAWLARYRTGGLECPESPCLEGTTPEDSGGTDALALSNNHW
jgi:transposase